jgi:hypothetical protein
MNVRSIFDAIPAFDSLRNLISQIGVPAKSKSHAWIFEPNCLTQYDVEAAYGSDWLPRKIVDIIPKHCTREWRTWQADQAEELYAAEKTLQVRLKVRKAMIYDRLYGGGALLMGAQTNDPEKPLDVATIKKGELRYLHALHRYQLTEGPDGADRPISGRSQCDGRVRHSIVLRPRQGVPNDGHGGSARPPGRGPGALDPRLDAQGGGLRVGPAVAAV